MAVQY